MYLLQEGGKGRVRVQLMGAGTILREVIDASKLLENDFGIPADVWSVTSFSELRRDGLHVDRWNRLHPGDAPRQSFVSAQLADREGPVVAASDYMQTVADQIRPWVPGAFHTLGTDGYGRSDGRAALRRHFEVDKHYVVVAALKALADTGVIDADTVKDAMKRFGIDSEKPDPVTL